MLHISAIFAYFSKVCISYIFQDKLAFSTAILILFVFLLLISITFCYRDHPVANRMAPSMCPDPCGTRWGSWFQAVLYHISAAYLAFMRSAYFNKMPNKTGMPSLRNIQQQMGKCSVNYKSTVSWSQKDSALLCTYIRAYASRDVMHVCMC